MIVVRQDDDCLHVYASLDAVTSQIEGLDAEDCLREVFDVHGQSYVVEWLTPNERGWLGGATNGTYRLVPDGPPTPKALIAMIHRIESEGRCPLPDVVLRLRASLEGA